MDNDLESNATKAPPAQAPRSRLLHSCGESILAVAESAYRRVEASGCAAGCLARGASCVAGPVLRPLRPRCLSALSFADRHLAAAQGAAAALFPRAERVLGGVDGFVILVESLPARFDGAAEGLEALVACVRGGVAAAAAGLAPAARARHYGKGAGNVFRDIRCDEEAVGGEDVAPGAESLGVVAVAVDGSGGEDGGAGDETKTGHGDSAAQAAKREVARAEAEKQEAEGKREGDEMNFDPPGAEQCSEGVKVEAVEANDPETMEALLSTGVVKVESQQVTSPELETGEGSGKDSNNNNGYLLDLFDEAWQGSSS